MYRLRCFSNLNFFARSFSSGVSVAENSSNPAAAMLSVVAQTWISLSASGGASERDGHKIFSAIEFK
jgi:hypothetical protein